MTNAAQRYPITAWSMCSALGHTTAESIASLRTGESALQPAGEALGLPFPTWVGTIPGRLPPVPEALLPWDCRQIRAALHSLAQLDGAAEAAVQRWGADRVAVIIGSTTGGMADTEVDYPVARLETGDDPYRLRTRHLLHLTADVLAAQIGAAGPVLVQSSACSSSTKVFGTARRLLDLGVIDAAVVGGVDTQCRFTLLGFQSLKILSETRCRPFSLERDGINLGEAGALVVLERHGTPRAWLGGVGETSDAYHMTHPRPGGTGLQAAIHQALAMTGLNPAAVDLVNAHATGTQHNDLAEAAALAATLPHRPPVVASKGYTGHTLGACGALEAVLCLVALEEGWAPPSITEGETEPGIEVTRERVERPFKVALSLGAAFAGHNSAVVLEAP